MAFNEEQQKFLSGKLDQKHVKTREIGGRQTHHIQGWHAVSEANRIFGHDGWNRETILTTCIGTRERLGDVYAIYTAKVRVSARAGDFMVVREASGCAEGRGMTLALAHELAVKSAETDAMKRALATFGNPFGLALYDPEQAGVRPIRERTPKTPADPDSQADAKPSRKFRPQLCA